MVSTKRYALPVLLEEDEGSFSSGEVDKMEQKSWKQYTAFESRLQNVGFIEHAPATSIASLAAETKQAHQQWVVWAERQTKLLSAIWEVSCE